jgi:uncharacterized damage-inducible protein DinB
MNETVSKPARRTSDAKEVLLGFLEYYRSVIARKVDGLPEAELRSSRVPSGWNLLELVKHLTYMERRWLVWGFRAEAVSMPYGDEDGQERWHVGETETPGELLAALTAGGARTREIVEQADLTDVAGAGGRFSEDEERPTLVWILVYVLQEYARHAGQMDVGRELLDGAVGE